MNSSLAGQLLSKVMEWDDTQLSQEAPWLQFMASMKYDSYDQYMPGTRFLASLVQWLGQFEEVDERRIVYEFIKKELIFISSTQVTYLVKLLYTTKIRPDILSRVAIKLQKSPYLIKGIEKSSEFKSCLRSSLIIGLSDGAHIDVLRRSAGLNNDQVLTNYYPSTDKTSDMLSALAKDETMQGKVSPKFETLYLVDDFTASGTSFLRKESENYKGKICKVLEEFNNEKSHFKQLFNQEGLIPIRLLFCIATEYAVVYIKNEIQTYLKEKNLTERFDIQVEAIQIIKQDISKEIETNLELRQIAEKYFYDSNEVMTGSYLKGKHDYPYLGYNEGALPIVLSHNTPNNSLPILWQYTTNMKGLFPRVNRHYR